MHLNMVKMHVYIFSFSGQIAFLRFKKKDLVTIKSNNENQLNKIKAKIKKKLIIIRNKNK